MGPRIFVADRNDIGMAGKHQMRPIIAEPGIEVLDIGRARFLCHDPVDGKAERFQHGFER
ncbi:hypothetical protein D3C71_2245050 [compost metagenome]